MAGQLWGTNSVGGFLYNDELSRLLRTEVRATCRFRQLCDAMDFSKKGYHAGQNVYWNTYSKLSTRGTTLTEGTAIPQTQWTVKQGTASVSELGNSVPFTNLTELYSVHNVTEVTRDALARDCREALDILAHAQFDRTLLRAVGTSTAGFALTTNGTATATNSGALGKANVRLMIETMKTRNIPTYRADDYLCVGRPPVFRTLRSDLESVAAYTETGYGKILRGEMGRFEACRFVEQTLIAAGVGNSGTAWTSGLSDWAYFMGKDTVSEIVVMPPEIRGKIPGDYGRDLGMAWYAVEGFGIVYGSANDDGTNSRIIKWDSAA